MYWTVVVISIHPVFGVESFAVSMQLEFSSIVIFLDPHHIPSICVPVYRPLSISGRSSNVASLYGVVVRLWELNHVALGTIFISCYQILGYPLNSSIFVSSRCWAIVFVCAFQGIQSQYYARWKGCVKSLLWDLWFSESPLMGVHAASML